MLHRLLRSVTLSLALIGGLALAGSGLGIWTAGPQPAHADDGGGDDGGGGGGGGGTGGASSGRGGGADRTSTRRATGCSNLFGLKLGNCKHKKSRAARKARSRTAQTVRRQRLELVLLAPDDTATAALTAAGFEIVDASAVGLTGGQVLRLRAPSGLSRSRALARATQVVPGAVVAENDVYRPASQCDGDCAPLQLVGWTPATHTCSVSTRVGMIDTGVDVSHPVLASARVTLKSFRGKDREASGAAHGTAVASVLVGTQGNEFRGLLTGTTLLAADAFHSIGREDRADVYSLVIALDWLTGEKADVINMSLSGPNNEVLARAVAAVTGRGNMIVAAAGNDRSSSSGYPGRYPGVVAVAGVDRRLRPMARAMRGSHIAFAAPASGIAVAKPEATTGSESGTSFAAPFVTAAYALAIHKGHPRPGLEAMIASTARDLGAPGRDRIFGHGLVQLGGLASCP